MTVTFVDSPGSTLPSSAEPLDFTTTLDVIAISVSFGSGVRVEERAYRDGVFLYPYLRSTQSGHTFSLVRDGGWPASPQVFVDENNVPASGQVMGAIYEVDLTAQASQSMATATSYTIDGLTWWAKGACGGSQACELVNGSGLRRYAADGAYPASYPNWRGNSNPASPDNTRALLLPLSQIPGFNPLAPLAIEWHLASPNAYSNDSGVCAYGGVIDAAASAAAITSGEKATAMTVAYYGGGGFFTIDNNANNITLTGTGTSYAGHAVGVYRTMLSRWYPLFGAYGSSLGVPDDYDYAGTGTASSSFRSRCSNSPSFCFVAEKGANFTPALDVYLTRLKVLQPKVP